MRVWVRTVGIVVVVAAGCVGGAAESDKVAQGKVTLAFVIDQGWGNGLVENEDLVALGRIIDALKQLERDFNVCVLVNPQTGDKTKLSRILDTLEGRGMAFMLDVWTSDTFTLGAECDHNAPYDAPHGISVSVDELGRYKARYGKWLVGLRFMEVFGVDFTIRMSTEHPEWLRPKQRIPSDSFFQPKIAEDFIRFASDNGMFVQWSDFHWQELIPSDTAMRDQEKQLCSLLEKYPGIVTMTYANNEPEAGSYNRLDSWEKSVEKFVAHGAKGFGLSDQSWIGTDECKTPVEEILKWANSALVKGCHYIQFEPLWYFFHLPRGTFDRDDYTDRAEWKERGMPRDSFNRLAEFLLQSAR